MSTENLSAKTVGLLVRQDAERTCSQDRSLERTVSKSPRNCQFRILLAFRELLFLLQSPPASPWLQVSCQTSLHRLRGTQYWSADRWLDSFPSLVDLPGIKALCPASHKATVHSNAAGRAEGQETESLALGSGELSVLSETEGVCHSSELPLTGEASLWSHIHS